MKRFFFLFLSFSLFLCSCNASPLPVPHGESEEAKTDLSVVPATYASPTLVENPLTWQKIEAIPKVSSAMTTDEMRQAVLLFAELSLSFQWTPKADFYVERQNNEYKVNRVYGGIPYDHGSGNPYKWLLYYDEETGVLDSRRVSDGAASLFSDCSAFAFSAWSRVSNSMTWNATRQITPHGGIIKVGEYEFDPEIVNFLDQNRTTTEICEKNGMQVMYRSYEKLLPADGVVNFLPVGGHVLLIKEVHTEKNATEIDGDESYVIFYDQRNVTVEKKQENGSSFTAQAGIDRRYSFRELFEKSYVPFGVKELYGKDPVEEATVATSLTKDAVSAEELCGASITSNYAIFTLHLSIFDESGKELYHLDSHVSGHPLFCTEYPLSKRLNAQVLKKYKGEGRRVTLHARVSTGNLLLAYEGSLI